MNEKVKILRPSKWKTISLLLLSFLMASMGYFILEESVYIAWCCMSFFGMGVLIFATELMPNASHLKLTEEGFEVKNIMRKDFIRWKDVVGFKVGYAGSRKMTMYDFSADYPRYKTGKKISKFLSGNHAALPNNLSSTILTHTNI